MDIVITLVVGAIVGWLAGLLMKARMGVLGLIVVGIAGSFLGRLAFGAAGLAASNALGGLIVSVVGAMALIAILRALRR